MKLDLTLAGTARVGRGRGRESMPHDIPAKSRLLPAIPITNPQFVYRRARETDVRATFARARAGLGPVTDPAAKPGARTPK